MTKKLKLMVLLFTLSYGTLCGQSIDVLKQKINKVIKDKHATVGISIREANKKEVLSINGNKHLPMQSVFKFHLALAVLYQVDQGSLSLAQRVKITKGDLNNNLYSPIRKKYPNGADLSLAEVLKYTVAGSDNVGCDLLFKLVGGPKVVESYLHKNGIKQVAIKFNEVSQQSKWARQYQNWTTANEANNTLQKFYENNDHLLSAKSHRFLWETMKSTNTGQKCIRGFLPKKTVIAHKTGHSGRNKRGLTGALNDIGIVFLPNGNYFYLSVLVSDSKEESSINRKIIADIAKLAWDYFENKSK